MEYALVTLLTVSVGLNLWLWKRKRVKVVNRDAAVELLADLLSSKETLIKLSRVAPEDMFLRSPRDLMS